MPFGIERPAARKVYGQRCGAACGIGGHADDRRLIGSDVSYAADGSRFEVPNIGIVVANIIQCAIRSLLEIGNVPIRAVERSVIRLKEYRSSADISVGIERYSSNPVLGVIAIKIAAIVTRRKLVAAIDKSANNAGVAISCAGIVRIGKDRIGETRGTACTLTLWPAVIRAGYAQIQFLNGRGPVVSSDLANVELAGDHIKGHAERVAQAISPDSVVVRARPIVKRVGGGNTAVFGNAQDLATRCVEPL